MGRYANATIRLDFPDLSEDGDPIWVTIRNPKRVPPDQLTPAEVPKNPDGTLDEEAVKTATFDVLAGLVVDWHVYDGNLDGDCPPLPLPATGEALRTLPFEIFVALSDALAGVVTPPQ